MFLEGGNSVLGARVFNSLVNGAALINKSYHKHRESYRKKHRFVIFFQFQIKLQTIGCRRFSLFSAMLLL